MLSFILPAQIFCFSSDVSIHKVRFHRPVQWWFAYETVVVVVVVWGLGLSRDTLVFLQR